MKYRSIARQIIIFVLAVILISAWQTRNLPGGIAPVLTMRAMDGEAAIVPDVSQRGISLIYFFAPWCGVCQLTIGNLALIQRWFPDVSVAVVALEYESPDEVREFIKNESVTAPVYLAEDRVGREWRVTGFPTYFVVGADQRIHATSIGYSTQLGMILRVLWTKVAS